MAREEPWPESCEVLLDELMQYPDRDKEAEILSLAGLANLILSDEAESDAVAAAHIAAAEILYREVIALDPDHYDASLGLSRTADDLAEEIEWLRNAYRAKEPNALLIRSLAGALQRQGSRESQLESAAILREAYDSRPWGTGKWNFAVSALNSYTRLGLDSDALEFRDIVSAEIGVDDLLDSLAVAESDLEASVETLRMLCYESVVTLVGVDACVSGAELLFAAAIRTEDSEISDQLTQAGLERMRAAPYQSGGAIDRVPGIVDWLEKLAAAGIDSVQLNFALGRCYLDLGRNREALDALERAWALPERDWRLYLDYYLRVARDPGARSSREQHFCIERDTITVN
jgi:tetratricopeptide (TPR) repeat protein